jgi:hypothetical protein
VQSLWESNLKLVQCSAVQYSLHVHFISNTSPVLLTPIPTLSRAAHTLTHTLTHTLFPAATSTPTPIPNPTPTLSSPRPRRQRVTVEQTAGDRLPVWYEVKGCKARRMVEARGWKVCVCCGRQASSLVLSYHKHVIVDGTIV